MIISDKEVSCNGCGGVIALLGLISLADDGDGDAADDDDADAADDGDGGDAADDGASDTSSNTSVNG